MPNCRCPIWFWSTMVVGLAVIITGGSVLIVMQTSITNQQEAFYNELGNIMQNNMKQDIRYLLNNLDEAALSLVEIEPAIKNCIIDNNRSYIPERMIELFNALSHDSTRQLGSLGFIRKAANTTNGKLSWQIALGFGCNDYIYAHADSTIHPRFLGYCAYRNLTINWNNTAYDGADWGLKPEEYKLLLANNISSKKIFLPIFPLIDRLMLTVQHVVNCGKLVPYGAVFAEQSLSQLDSALQLITADKSSEGNIAFIYENISGYLVSASIGGLTQRMSPNDISGQVERVKVSDVEDVKIKRIYKAINENKVINPSGEGFEFEDWWILSVPFSENDNVDWVMVSVVPVKGYIQTIRNISGMAAGIASAIVIIVLSVSIIITIKFVSNPLKLFSNHIKNYLPLGDEIQKLDETSNIEEIADLVDHFKK